MNTKYQLHETHEDGTASLLSVRIVDGQRYAYGQDYDPTTQKQSDIYDLTDTEADEVVSKGKIVYQSYPPPNPTPPVTRWRFLRCHPTIPLLFYLVSKEITAIINPANNVTDSRNRGVSTKPSE